MKEFWSDNEIYIIYSNATFQPCKADIFRYCIIMKEVVSILILKVVAFPFSKLQPSNGAIISHEASNTIIPPIKNTLKLQIILLI